MGYQEAHDRNVLRHFEGLVFATAVRYAPFAEDELEDIEQALRIKVWEALIAFKGSAADHVDARSCRCARCRYVFMCMKNRAKDTLRKPRRGNLSLDHLREVNLETAAGGTQRGTAGNGRDRFDGHYLATDHAAVYGGIEDEALALPETLTQLERRLVVLLYRDYKQKEAAEALGLSSGEVERAVRSIRLKLAAYRPVTEDGRELAAAA